MTGNKEPRDADRSPRGIDLRRAELEAVLSTLPPRSIRREELEAELVEL
jgi:hypothetical protein